MPHDNKDEQVHSLFQQPEIKPAPACKDADTFTVPSFYGEDVLEDFSVDEMEFYLPEIAESGSCAMRSKVMETLTTGENSLE